MNRKIISFVTAVTALSMLAGCGARDDMDNSDRGNAANAVTSAPSGIMGSDSTDRTTLQEQTITPVQGKALSTIKQGYGQGVQLDEDNRPLGALDFNAKYSQYNAKAISEKGSKILLTFDQGYENGYTEKILDVLKKKKVKAVFFVVQDYAERNPELVKRMIDEGHTIGNHSVTHRSMPDLSAEECAQEINGLNDYIEEKFGKRPSLFRPPMGEFSELSLAVAKQCGCETILWSFAYADWDVNAQPDPGESKQKLVDAAHEGAIYLLHSVSSTNAEILGDFIDEVRADGFEFY